MSGLELASEVALSLAINQVHLQDLHLPLRLENLCVSDLQHVLLHVVAELPVVALRICILFDFGAVNDNLRVIVANGEARHLTRLR